MPRIFWLEDERSTARLDLICATMGIDVDGPHEDVLAFVDALAAWKGDPADALVVIDILRPGTHWIRTFSGEEISTEPSWSGLRFAEANLCGEPNGNYHADRWAKVPIMILTQLKIDDKLRMKVTELADSRDGGDIAIIDKYGADEAEILEELRGVLSSWVELLEGK